MTAESLGNGLGGPQVVALPPSVRDEHQALTRVLRITIGGEPLELRTLNVDESDAWLAELNAAMAGLEVPTDGEGADILSAIMIAPAAAALRVVAAYDKEGRLGGLEALRARASKREVKAALDAMVEAEDPFGEDVARSVGAGFGAPSRFLALGMRVLLGETLPPRVSSTTGPSAAMASATPSSAGPGAASSSSSAGTTARRRRKRT